MQEARGRQYERAGANRPDSPLALAGKAMANFIRNGFFSVAVSKIRFNAWPESFGGRPKSGFASNRQNRRAGSPPSSLPLSSGSSPFGRLKESSHTPTMDRQPAPPQTRTPASGLSPSCNWRPFDELRSTFAYRFQCLVIQEARIIVFLAPSELRGPAQPRKISIYL